MITIHLKWLCRKITNFPIGQVQLFQTSCSETIIEYVFAQTGNFMMIDIQYCQIAQYLKRLRGKLCETRVDDVQFLQRFVDSVKDVLVDWVQICVLNA